MLTRSVRAIGWESLYQEISGSGSPDTLQLSEISVLTLNAFPFVIKMLAVTGTNYCGIKY